MKKVILVCIIVLLVIMLGVFSVLYFNKIKDTTSTVKDNLENLNEIKNKTSKDSNFLVALNENYPDTIGKHISIDYEATTVYTEGESTDTFISCFDVIYYYTGVNTGKLFINEKEVNLNDKLIQDMRIGTNYDGLYAETLKIGESYNFNSTLYILFDDGTLGKISTEDIKNGNYNITIMSEYNDIDYFIETEPIEHGGDTLLWAVSRDGKVFKIDMVSAGN